MLGKLLILAIMLIVIAGYFLFSQTPVFKSEIKQEKLKPEAIPSSPLEFPNLRWSHIPLTVYIEERTPEKMSYIPDVKLALETWEDATSSLVSFKIVDDKQSADITVTWVEKLKAESLDAAGDANIKFYNQTNFKIITHADVELLNKVDGQELSDFDMINLALHEIGHALGLSHNDAEDSIMNPILKIPSKAVKSIMKSEIELLLDAYRLEPKPDIFIAQNSTATKIIEKRLLKEFHYINAVITAENRGLVDSKNTTMQIKADGVVVKEADVPEIPVGAVFTRTYINLYVENDFNTVEIVLDPGSILDEYDKKNNVLVLKV